MKGWACLRRLEISEQTELGCYWPEAAVPPSSDTQDARCSGAMHSSASADSEPRASSQDKSSVYLQICLPDRRTIVEETTVDVTDIAENLSPQEWQDILLKATVVGRYDRSEAAQRTLVTIRAVRPAEDPYPAERWLGMGEVAIGHGVGSLGSRGLPLADSTDRDQAVYQAMTTKQQGEIVAVNVERHLERGGKKEMITFWFKPPQGISRGSYTEWQAPVLQEGAREPGATNMGFLLLDGKDLPTSAVDNLAPRIRYTLMPWEEYTRGDQPRTRALRMKALREATGASPGAGAPRIVKGSIPNC